VSEATTYKSLSVVIPVFNSEAILGDLVHRLRPVLASVASSAEVILVNDGSHDQSWKVICHLSRQFDWVHGINLMRNYGQHNALLCGIRAARSDIIVTMDDDLQHPPEEIPKLLAKLAEGYDVVYGTPLKARHGFWRNLASDITKLALRSAVGAGIARQVSAFRAFRTSLREAFSTFDGPFVSIDVLLTWGTTRFASVAVRHDPRPVGISRYTFGRLVTHALNMMTGFSTFPLQVASLIGFSLSLFGLGVLGYVVGRYLIYGGSVPGFPFLASVISIFSGAQLLSLGIIGEYLARMHFRMMGRPTYVAREATWERIRQPLHHQTTEPIED
jgi:undecaprenyl-phosphate 4-deoxy-4-formamido-L-arabinose transferase